MDKKKHITAKGPFTYSAWQDKLGRNQLIKSIWFLADPNNDEFDPKRALKKLNNAIQAKWYIHQSAREAVGLRVHPDQSLEELLHKPIKDSGDVEIEKDVRAAVKA